VCHPGHFSENIFGENDLDLDLELSF